VVGEEPSLTGERKVLIFRIAQETLNNAIVHARPTAIQVLLQFHNNWLELEIQDNEQGFEYPPKDKPHGAGLSNMQARAGFLDGKLTISSDPEKEQQCIFLCLMNR
jgi:signal transduction histidine kinase